MQNKKVNFAFFDLDHTLLAHDTQLLFCNYIIKKYPKRRLFIPLFILTAPIAIFSRQKTKTLKQIFLSYLFNLDHNTVEKHAEKFTEKEIIPKIFPEIQQKLKSLQNNKNTISVLTTASPDIYAKYIAKKLNFDIYFATKIAYSPKYKLFPPIIGKNNKNKQKIIHFINANQKNQKNNLNDLLKNEIQKAKKNNSFIKNSSSFSDSSADLPLLKIAQHKYLINPNKKLRKIGEKNKWNIITTKEKPIHSYTNKIIKILGLY